MKVRQFRRLLGIVLFVSVLFFISLGTRIFAATSFGTYLGQFNTVAAFSNGSASYYSSISNFMADGFYTGVKWQCVEFVRRYYYTIFNTRLSNSAAGDAGTWYPNASALGLTAYQNGQSTSAPQVGDILCSTTHIAIIKRISGNKVYTAQQNVSQDSSDLDKQLTLSVSGGKYTLSGGYGTLQGWLRKQVSSGQSGSYWHPDGSLLVDSVGTVWLVQNGKRRAIPSDWVFASNGFTWYRLIRSTAQELSCIPTDANLSQTSISRLVSAPSGTTYMLTDKGYKRGFASADVFSGLGYSWSEVTPITTSELAAYPDDPVAPVLTSPLPDGTLIQASGSTTIYVITNGKKRGITSASAFQALGYDWNRIVVLPATTFNSIGEIQPAIDDNMLQCH